MIEGRREHVNTGIAVVIVAFNNADTIARSIARASELPGCEQVIVVDNGTDGSADVAATAGATVLRRPENPGFGTSQNVGVALVDQPFVLLLNPDADPDPTGVALGIATLQDRPDAAVVQGIITSRHHGGPERSMGPDLRWVHLVGRAFALRRLLGTALGRRLAVLVGVGDHVERVPEGATEVETISAVAPLVRTEAFNSIGGFDEAYFLYGEDLDLCRRLRRDGWHLIGLPVPWATHADGSTSESSVNREVSWWEGTLRYAALWWSRPHWCAAVAASAVAWARIAAKSPSGRREAWQRMIDGPVGQRSSARTETRCR